MDIRVLGLGNVLMGDDGFGPYVVETLRADCELPPEVSIVDLGTPGFDLAPFLIGADAVIVIDTVRADGRVGDVRTYDRAALLTRAPGPRLGPHDPGFAQAVLTLDFAGIGPPSIVLVGAIPQTIAPWPGLSPALRAAVPRAVDAVLRELRRLGITARPNAAGHLPPWWDPEDHAILRKFPPA